MRRVLVTGAAGQIGAELVPALREALGADSVVASDLPGGAVAGRSLPHPPDWRPAERIVRRES
jgi:uncharacterized protein YbjT (DUF2867 family)